MEGRDPLKVVGWLGSAGYQIVINKPAQKTAQAALKRTASKATVITTTRIKKSKKQS